MAYQIPRTIPTERKRAHSFPFPLGRQDQSY
nr:MAG TPA: hypothetical protein [Caudoviricetes sp.]